MKLTTLKPRVQTLTQTRLSTVNPDSWRSDKKTSSQRGYGYAWQKAREGYLSHHPLCVMCMGEGRAIPATVVDHKVAHRGDQGIFWDKSNWQSLCATHHSSHAQKRDNATL